MSDRLLTELVKAESLNAGMDLVGFAPVSRWAKAPYLLSPPAILPQAQTVVVSAIHITDTWTEMGGEPEPQDRSPGGWMDQNSLLDRVAYRLVRLLNDHGHQAIAVASSNIWRYRKYEGIPSVFAPDLSHIHAAAAAGLAEIGWCGLAITPEFGARCRYISVVTSADLVATPMYAGPKLCDMCMACKRACPTGALSRDLKGVHTVEIGGKTFQYAHKNIWRCAWGEHFNLDLNSPSLKEWDNIGEKEIMAETMTKGRRGHERGVCQKVCVPPHLRTNAPSFGRADKLIAQNRINRRYPDTMPTLRKMRDDLSAMAFRLGVDAASVGPLDPNTDAGRLAVTEAPGVKSVLAFAMRLPAETRRLSGDAAAPYQYGFYRLMHHVLLRVARAVEDCGYHAASYTGTVSAGAHPAHGLAAMAGLGRVNDKGALVMPEFGEDVIVGAITTDAPLDPTPADEPRQDTSVMRRLSGAGLRRDLERLAAENLVSMFGVAKAEVFDNVLKDLRANVNEAELAEEVVDVGSSPIHGPWVSKVVKTDKRLRSPADYVPGAKSVIVLGMHFPDELIRNAGLEKSQQIGTYAFHQYQTCFELRYAAVKLAQRLNRMGFATRVTEDMLGVGSVVDSPRGKLPDARCNAIEAVAAGLGQMGRSGSLLTREHGPHQRCIVIVTDAELPADSVDTGEPVCLDCGACARQCPTAALTGPAFDVRVNGAVIRVPRVERHRCDWSKAYSLCASEGPGLIGNMTGAPPPQGRRVTIADLAAACEKKDPLMKRRTCILETCLRRCPAGEGGARRARMS